MRISLKRSYLLVKFEVWDSLALDVKEDGSLHAKLRDEHDDCVLPHKQYESLLVQYASALEEQLGKHDEAYVCSRS